MGQLDDDLDFILADQVTLTGQGKVVWAGKKIDATFDDADQMTTDANGQPVIQDGQVIRCRTAKLPTTAKRGDTLTVDGVSYKAKDLRKQDEGRVTLIELGSV